MPSLGHLRWNTPRTASVRSPLASPWMVTKPLTFGPFAVPKYVIYQRYQPDGVKMGEIIHSCCDIPIYSNLCKLWSSVVYSMHLPRSWFCLDPWSGLPTIPKSLGCMIRLKTSPITDGLHHHYIFHLTFLYHAKSKSIIHVPDVYLGIYGCSLNNLSIYPVMCDWRSPWYTHDTPIW
jgi:hypothetical protein